MVLLEEKKKTLSIAIAFVLTIAYFVAFFSGGFEYPLSKPGAYAIPVLLTVVWWLILGLNQWVRVLVGVDACIGILGLSANGWISQELGFFASLGALLLTLLWVDKFDENKARAAAVNVAEKHSE